MKLMGNQRSPETFSRLAAIHPSLRSRWMCPVALARAASSPGSIDQKGAGHGQCRAHWVTWVRLYHRRVMSSWASLLTSSRIFVSKGKPPKCPLTEEWIKKMWYIYTVKYYSAVKKNEIMPFVATWMDLEIIVLSEVSQRRKNVVWYHLYVESKK